MIGEVDVSFADECVNSLQSKMSDTVITPFLTERSYVKFVSETSYCIFLVVPSFICVHLSRSDESYLGLYLGLRTQ